MHLPSRTLPFAAIILLLPAVVLGESGAAARLQLQEDARQALHLLSQEHALTVSWTSAQPTPAQVLGLELSLPGETDLARAQTLLSRYPALFAGQSKNLVPVGSQGIRGRRMVRFQQRYLGLEVLGAQAIVTFDTSHRVIAINSSVVSLALQTVHPALKPDQAVAIAAQAVEGSKPAGGITSRTQLIVLAEGRPRLAYKVSLPMALDPRGRLHLVDARSGAYLGWRRGVIVDQPRYLKEVGR